VKTVTYPIRIGKRDYQMLVAEAKRRRKSLADLFRDLITYGLPALPPIPEAYEALQEVWTTSAHPRKSCMTNFPRNGDILLVDLGMVAKVRPCLVLCANPDSERTVSLVAPLTGEVRGGESEIPFPKAALACQALCCQPVRPWLVERHRLQRRLGQFPPEKFDQAKKVLARMFGLELPSGQPRDAA